ncbi:RNA polymerase sigma factor, RpoD/SigA family [Planktothrix sp. FACHB-1355]|uniref:RNA polymerase sigma factor n=1 Tax=Aerosakkonema funiforme FACHB-1375 TaxID=2949571 RepID=A0A926ZHA8_9CYAN|nr:MULTISPECIES: RNA polymerase sigma factor, RpoD/SigA family [Oscillatoriales]MBD2180711.1 RNA polymerase sigma factor, RpoD/SigA family [Aerosakkonema funiforme FACHB-1375]MBD3559078.1 RNA polymerase sigma factor, RpoD/SigA family [Planktothrix sp. FACHB-1355]
MSISATLVHQAQPNFTRDTIRSYLLEIGRIPLLTKEQEIIYGKEVQQMMAIYEQKEVLTQKLGCEPSAEEWAEQAHLDRAEMMSVLAKGKQAKHRMIEANLRLVVSVAKKYQKRGVEFLDLIQEGTLGLERGIEKFDPKQGYKLSTYVYWWIRQGMTKAISQQGRTIRLPSHIYERLTKIKKIQRQLFHDLGRNGTPSEIAQVLEIETSEVRKLLLIARRPFSLDLRVGENQDTEFVEMLEDESPSPEEYMMGEALRDEVGQLLAELSPRQREVVILRFGLENNQAQSLQQIGELLGLSRERVRQIEMQALANLRRHRSRVREYLVI